MLERFFGISNLIDFNHECDCGFAVVRIWLAYILPRDAIEQLEISISTAFHYAAAELRSLYGSLRLMMEMATRGSRAVLRAFTDSSSVQTIK